ncbi:MAG: copper chaperone PCu(A)C [Hyphomicrobiaceae bacterium]
MIQNVISRRYLLGGLCLAFVAWRLVTREDSGHDASVARAGDLTIHAAWARATPKGAKVGAAYLVVTNNGSAPDRLVSVESPIAARVQIHEMKMTDGVMKMRAMEGGLTIPAGARVELEPGLDHLMLMGLKGPIKRNDPFTATLTFEKAGTVEVMFETVAIGASPEHSGHGE